MNLTSPHSWLALCAAVFFVTPIPAAEWDDLLGSLGNLVTVGGASGQGPNNPNEWLTQYEGGPATMAELSEPHMAMDDVKGNIYVADKNAHAIRKITPQGTIHTVAGRHVFRSPNVGGFDGDGVATQKLLAFPNGLFVFPNGVFFILEQGDSTIGLTGRIRKVDLAGQMTTLTTHTTLNRGLWVRHDEQLMYFCSPTQLLKWTPAGGKEVLATFPTGADLGNIDVDPLGHIYVTSRGLHCCYRIPPTGVSTLPAPVAGVVGSQSNLPGGGNGGQVTLTGLDGLRGVAFHPLGGYLLCTHRGGDVWYVDQTGIIRLLISGTSANDFAGENQPIAGTTTVNKIAEPRSVRVGWNGDIIIATNDSGYIRVAKAALPPRESLPFSYTPSGQLSWPGQTGKGYLMENSTNLQTWEFIHSVRPVSNGPLQLTPPVGNRQFFRVYEHRTWPF